MLGALITRSRTSSYTVHEPPDAAGSALERAENLVFVRDGFSWLAAIFSPFYFIVRGEWRAFLLYVVAATALSAVLYLFGAAPDLTGLAMLFLNIVIGFEMSELRRWSLSQAGWQEVGSVSGIGQDEAERRFFEAWLPSVKAAAFTPDLGNRPGAPSEHASTVQSHRAMQGLAARLREKFAIKT